MNIPYPETNYGSSYSVNIIYSNPLQDKNIHSAFYNDEKYGRLSYYKLSQLRNNSLALITPEKSQDCIEIELHLRSLKRLSIFFIFGILVYIYI